MYYAEYCLYGTRIQNYRWLCRFATKAERDQWVDDDVFENDWHRQAVSRKEAERRHPTAFSIEPPEYERWEAVCGHEEWPTCN